MAESNTHAIQEGERKAVLRKALEAIDSLQARLDAVERDRSEPIAIVGLSCRFPGASDPNAFWQLLSHGVDAVREVPSDRWSKDAYYDPDPSAPGKMHAAFGGFLDGLDLFDAALFGISGREAETMDPQQRLLLEMTWEALENANIAPEQLRGSATGTFVGITTTDYARMGLLGGAASLDVYTATGGALNAAAGRVSFVFGFNGPAMAIDTACSSSLVAVHLACQSLRSRESDYAMAGGVNVLLTPEPFVCFAKWGMMAPDGRCKTFDEKADGFVRGEGCGMIVLRRLSDAQAAGDRILAVIRGTAVNQDGASSGLTVPNGLAQQAVVRTALKNARLQPHQIDYVEAHGTGTALGDPIELEALAAVLGKNRPAATPLRVGSVKTNIGHLESASGIAGLIKVVLSLGREQIPRHINFQKLNPRISLGNAPIEIPARPVSWPRSERPRIAGVSSFGFSGTNAHVILEEATLSPAASPTSPPRDRPLHLMVLSAKTEGALRKLAESHGNHLAAHPDLSIADVCHSAATGRAALLHRLAFPCGDSVQAQEMLKAFAQGKSKPPLVSGRIRGEEKVAFLFTGQGAQYPGMGKALYETEPVFRDAFDRCAEVLQEHLDRPLQEIIGYTDVRVPESLLNETRVTQPALFSLEYALASLWRSWGIEPAAVAGHSLGEFVAACVAGVLSLEDALRLVAVRSRLMQALPRDGDMAAVLASEDDVRKAILPYADTISIAAANGPRNTVISGKAEHIRAVIEQLKQNGVEAKLLKVSHAFHSPLIEPMLDEFERFAQQIAHHLPTLDVILNGTGNLLEDSSPLDAAYWRRHARGTVRFADSIRTLRARGIKTFIEVGPSPVLIGMARRCVEDADVVWLPSLRKDHDAWEQMLSSLGGLFVLGYKPDWSAFDRPHARRHVSLPNYPFQRERYWLPVAAKDSAHATARSNEGVHPLLGVHVPLAGRPGEHVWHGEISLGTCPWVDDHRVQGVAVVPATAYIEMALSAAIEAFGPPPVVLKRIELKKVLSLQGEAVFELQTRLVREGNGNVLFEVYSRSRGGKDWTEHVSGTLRMGLSTGKIAALPQLDVAKLQKEFPEQLDGAEFYRLHHERGNQWGTCFRGTKRVWYGQGMALGEIESPAEIVGDLGRFLFHPALSDASGHVLTATIPLEKGIGSRGGAFVGAGIEEIRFHRRMSGQKLWAYAQLRPEVDSPANVLVGDVSIYDETGALVAETIGARLWYLDSAQEKEMLAPVDNWFYAPRWVTREFAASGSAVPVARAVWVVFQDRQGVGEALCRELRERGATCVSVFPGDEFRNSDSGGVHIRPEEPADYDRLMNFIAELRSPLAGVVHLWSLDAAGTDEISSDVMREAESHGIISVMRLVQAMKRVEVPGISRLWLVTRGAQPAAESPGSLEVLQSPMWGFGKVVGAECSELWGGQVDLDPADEPERAAALLMRQMIDLDKEDQVAFRNGQRRVLRLDRIALSPKDTGRPPVRSDAAYLITGGLGGIGGEIARWLVAQGARHLYLAGRRALPPRTDWEHTPPESDDGKKISLVRELEKQGATVRAVSVDVADEASMREMMSQCLQSDAPPLRGVFHAAGVMQYKLLTDQTPEDLRDVLNAKVRGGWLLHHGLAQAELDYFVLFSSSSALLSSPMMAGYSAANVFLDALAHHRRARGLPAVSINWGTWTEAGMATRFKSQGEFDRQGRVGAVKGVTGLTTKHALEALERLLDCAPPQIGVMPIDWKEWGRSYGAFAKAAYLSLLVTPDEQDSNPTAPGESPTMTGLRDLPAEVLPEKLRNYLAQTLAQILKVPAHTLDHETPLAQMGFDSLMAIELKARIESDIGLKISMSRLIQGPPVVTLAQWLQDLLSSDVVGSATAAGKETANAYEEGEV